MFTHCANIKLNIIFFIFKFGQLQTVGNNWFGGQPYFSSQNSFVENTPFISQAAYDVFTQFLMELLEFLNINLKCLFVLDFCWIGPNFHRVFSCFLNPFGIILYLCDVAENSLCHLLLFICEMAIKLQSSLMYHVHNLPLPKYVHLHFSSASVFL